MAESQLRNVDACGRIDTDISIHIPRKHNMLETKPQNTHSFVLQKQAVHPSRQPLEIYHLSHDLRGPLNSMLGFTELLLEGIEGPLNDIQREDIAAIRQSARNLLQLINAVVDLSKLEANKLSLNFGPVRLQDVFQNILQAEPGSNPIKLVMPNPFPLIWGDRERIEQMILGLINFVRKIKNQSRLEVTVVHDEHHALTQIQAAELLIPSEQIDELFDLSVKVDAAGRSELGWGGLALPLIWNLARKQQGQLWIESRAGMGTIFYLKLPLHQPNS
jgi:signal transduction histidine kinase